MNPRNIIIRVATLFLFINLANLSRSQPANFQTTIIEPYPLKITLNKTTNIIFPYSIKSVDRGSADVLAQKAKGVENILLVKAGKEHFLQTNLSVITADGKLYSFVLDYVNNPSAINISFVTDSTHADISSRLKPIYNELAFELDAEKILKHKKKIHGVKNFRDKVGFSLKAIFIKNDIIFFKLEVVNNSRINYDIDMLRFFIVDEKKANRTASQEIEIHPLYVQGDTSTIQGDEKNTLVFALPKFTIPDKKFLSVQLMEKKGGRNLHLRIGSRTIMKAKSMYEP